MIDLRFIVFDTETTDVTKAKRACEVAMMEIDPETLEEKGRVSSLINPGIPISTKASEINGITDEMVKDAPTIEDWVMDTFGGRLEGEVALIGHRIAFDRPLFEPIGHAVHMLDTLVLAQVYLTPEEGRPLENRKLGTLKAYLGLEGGDGDLHRGMEDVVVCHQLLKYLVPLTGRKLEDLATVPYSFLHFFPWGKYEGWSMWEVPRSYREWALSLNDLDINLRKSLETVAQADPPRRVVIPTKKRTLNIPQRKKK